MIAIGLTTWSEHGHLIGKKTMSLEEYAGLFPVIEINTSFYAIPKVSIVDGWLQQVPPIFRFVVKAFQGMTRQKEWTIHYESEQAMFAAFAAFIQPLATSQQLAGVLFQFPSFFTCTPENVAYLLTLRQAFPNNCLIVEFRHASWYSQKYRQKMLAFMRHYGFVLAVIDEPQVANHSVPYLPIATNDDLVYFRLHGRNQGNWTDTSGDWRKKRHLYCYSEEELSQMAKDMQLFNDRDVIVTFNNNSAGDAGGNALLLKRLLGIDYQGLNPHQLPLF